MLGINTATTPLGSLNGIVFLFLTPATKGGVVRRQNAPVPSLPPMFPEQRKVVHELAEHYRLETESHGR